MYRQKGLLNFTQIFQMVSEKFADVYDNFEQDADDGITASRQSAALVFDVVFLLNALESVTLLCPGLPSVEMDAEIPLRQRQDFLVSNKLEEAYGTGRPEGIRLWQSLLLENFVNISFPYGLVREPPPWRRRFYRRWEWLPEDGLMRSRYANYAVLVDEEAARRQASNHLSILDKQGEQPSIGRPLIALEAAKQFRARYPNGRGAQPWKAIEEEMKVSSKTIRKGLGLLEGKEQGKEID